MSMVEEFRGYIRRTKSKAADQGVTRLLLDAEGIRLSVAGAHAGYGPAADCRQAMIAEARIEDEFLPPRNGQAANLTVLYKI